jgi:hypothetical protein
MPPTVHRILVHGSDVIKTTELPIGMFAEHASESLNKFYRNDRQFHARKNSMKANILDMFTRIMQRFDPFLVNIKFKTVKKISPEKLPAEVFALLKPTNNLSNDSDEDSEDDDSDVENMFETSQDD